MARISIERKHIFVFLLVVIVAAVTILIYKFHESTPLTTYTYYVHDNYGNRYGIPMVFRADLRKASNVSIYPDASTVYNIIWNENTKNITIAFVNSSDNGLVATDAFEIAYKLGMIFKVYNMTTNFTANVISSYDNITANESYPVIVLIPPSMTNNTSVLAANNVIYIQGNTTEEFDLATIKFLMSVLDIKVD
jgi:hypothetical protein